MKDFSFLKDVYQKWKAELAGNALKSRFRPEEIYAESRHIRWNENGFDALSAQFGKTINNLAIRLGLSPNQFFATYVVPFVSLDMPTTRDVLEVVAAWTGRRAGQRLDIDVTPYKKDKELIILEWLDMRVHNLKLSGLTTLNYPVAAQCHYCGAFEDKTDEPFNNKKVYCHTKLCPPPSKRISNPKLHRKAGCCYGIWSHKRTMFKQEINRLDPENADIKAHISQAFIEFCQSELEDIPRCIKEPVQFVFTGIPTFNNFLDPCFMSFRRQVEEYQTTTQPDS